MERKKVAALFREMADLMDLLGEDRGKAAAYRRAAYSLESSAEDLEVLAAEGRLQTLPGIGPHLAKKVEEILRTGTARHLEGLRARVPEGVRRLTSIPGVGPRTAGQLYRSLGIVDADDLERAIRAGTLLTLAGFGERRVEAIAQGLEQYRRYTGRFLLSAGRRAAEEVLRLVRTLLPGCQAEAAGSLRRGQETLGDVDLVVASARWEEAASLLRDRGAREKRPEGEGYGRLALASSEGLEVEMYLVPPEAFFGALLYFTGSRAHLASLERRAEERGLRLTPLGLREVGGMLLPAASEEHLYRILGLPFIPPELREGEGEVEAAERGALPKLVELADIRGDLHVHTSWSDGSASILTMARAAAERGYEYLAISDHSRSLAVARGLDGNRLSEQAKEIEAAERRLRDEGFDLRILKSAEVDILKDGELDLEPEVLASLHLVTASVHSALHQPRDEFMARLERAFLSPWLDILGHPTCRLLGRRGPSEVDPERLFARAAGRGVALEINSSPDRLDLPSAYLRRAKELGVRFVISTDAHEPEGLGDVEYGVRVARRGWLTPQDILNTRPREVLLSSLRRSAAAISGPSRG